MSDIDKWNKLTNKIISQWIKTYFELEDEEVDVDWVNNDIGSVLEFADYYISFSDILDCYKHKITKEQFHNWYSYCLEEPYINISLAKFTLSPEEKAKKEKESLEKAKQNVIFAEELLKQELERYETTKNK